MRKICIVKFIILVIILSKPILSQPTGPCSYIHWANPTATIVLGANASMDQTSILCLLDAITVWNQSGGCVNFTYFSEPPSDPPAYVEYYPMGSVSCTDENEDDLGYTEKYQDNETGNLVGFIIEMNTQANWCYTGSPTSSQQDFETVVIHELGHALGLVHYSVSSSTMSPTYTCGTTKLLISSDVISCMNSKYYCNLTPTCTPSTCPLPSPTNFSINIVGGYPVLTWDQYSATFISGLEIYRNGTFLADLSTSATTYTDLTWNSSISNSYYVDVWKLGPFQEGMTYPITVTTSPGTISSSATWSGLVYVNSNVTVNSGVTLNIISGTKVLFNSGQNYGITVNGSLYANGATFTSNSLNPSAGNWGSIILSGSGSANSNINSDTFNYGSKIQFSNGANATIQNSTINNCLQGIYIYGASPSVVNNQILNPTNEGIYIDASSNSPAIHDNLIKKTTGQSSVGIYSNNNSSPVIGHNRIGGFGYGIYIGGSSNSVFNGYSSNQNNLVYGNSTGITAGWGGTIIGGYQGNGMYNSIHGNSNYDAYSYQSGTLHAEYDYWGTAPQRYCDGSSTLDYANSLGTNDPWGGATPLIEMKNGSKNKETVESLTIPNPIISDSSLTDLYAGLALENKGDLSGAILQYMGLVAKDINADFAITELFKLFRQYSRVDILNYFESFSSSGKHYPLISKMIADNNLQTGEFDKAISTYDNLIRTYPNDYYGINAKFQKLFAYLNIKNDKTTAQQILSQIESMHLTDPLWFPQIQLAENMLGSSNNSNNSENSITPTGYSVRNYPNPFNPSTVIEYQLPSNGLVTLIVFDVLGREVKTLVNDYKTSGTYTVSFDASKLASGIYFYQLRSGNYISTKKMLLLK